MTILIQKQPIESAPRDGTIILVWFGQDGVSQARYTDHIVDHVSYPWEFIDRRTNGDLFVNHAIDGPGGPSHWAAMPK